MDDSKKLRGFKTSHIFIPTVGIFAIIHSLIIIVSILINITSDQISKRNQESSECISTISAILSHSSKLSDTAATFIYTPEIQMGPTETKLNNEPLTLYIEELTNPDRNINVLKEQLKGFEINAEANEHVNTALSNLEAIIAKQAHAIYLINDKVIEIPGIENIQKYELTEAEEAYTKAEAKQAAIKIIFEKEYSWNKRDVANEVNLATDEILEANAIENKTLDDRLDILRVFIWVLIIAIVVIAALFFVMFFRILVLPINNFSKKINNNEKLDCDGGVYEMNFLAFSYNNLLDRRETLETELRYTAEIDSLTGLNNRYAYNEFLKQPEEKNKKVCALLFDINKLKQTNDTYGHSKGDELIKNASLCIKECFTDYNCFRIGGDEFVVIIENKNENIKELLDAFEKKEKEYNVSMAVGYAYTDDISSLGYEKLIIQADKMMYNNKQEMEKQI